MKAAGFTHDSVDNKTVEWYTPSWIFESLGLQFDVDVAAPEGGVEWIPATNHYSIKDNGLIAPWRGKVWCNPPYGPETSKWLERMHEYRNGVALVFARTDTKWFHDYCIRADGLLFLKGRVKFVDGLGVTSGNGAGAGSMLIAWGDECAQALRGMRKKGWLVSR